MNGRMMQVAVMALTAVLLPMSLIGQQNPMDPNGNQNGTTIPNQSQPGVPNAAQPQQSTMRDSLGAPGMTGQEMQDKQFLIKAAEGGIAEVQLGILATQKGSPEVKEFGQKMVDDHTQINKDMAAIADQMGVMLPKKMNKDDAAEYAKLQTLSGDSFDKEYIAYMIRDHRADLHAFRTEAASAGDQNLQSEVTKASGVIWQHMQMVVKLAQQKGVPVPQRQPRPAPAGQ